MVDIEFLENERKLLWKHLSELESISNKKFADLVRAIDNKTTDDEKISLAARRKAVEHKNIAVISNNKINELKEEIEGYRNHLQTVINDITTNVNATVDASSKASQEATSIEENSSEITSIYEETKSKLAQLNQLIAENVELKNNVSALKLEMSTATESCNNINTLEEESIKINSEIKSLKNIILGYSKINKDTKEVTKVEGLRHELENSYYTIKSDLKDSSEEIYDFKESIIKKYEDILSEWNKNYSDLEKEIRTLLPNAMTAGLSHAYEKKRLSENVERKQHENVFYASIGALSLISMIPFTLYTYLYFSKDLAVMNIITTIPRVVLSILPLYLPALWLAYSSSLKIRLSKRLIEEYSHKEALSKTYEGLSSQVDKISCEKTSEELSNKLLYNLISVSSENPGKLISDYNKSDHPFFDVIDKSITLTRAVDKLTILPGTGKLISLLKEKIDTKSSLLSDEITNGLKLGNESNNDDKKVN